MAIKTLHRTVAPFVLLAAAACGSVNEDSPPRPDAAADAATGTTEPCLPGSYDIDKEWSDDGTLAIAGTVTFPATVSAGTTVWLAIKQVGSAASDFQPQTLTADQSEVTYRFWNVTDGNWTLCAGADLDNNGSTGDAGIDYIGCYDGTSDAPITSEDTATPVALGGACHPGTDFATALAP